MAIKRLQGEWERRNGYYYELDTDSEPLGEGGMGVVYLGYCISVHSDSRRYVAIKQLRDDLSAEGYQRAVREASIRIRHENLVEMLGFISSAETDPYDGQITRHYVVSEFLYGVLLSDVLEGQYRDSKGNEIPFAKNLSLQLQSDKINAAGLIIRHVLSGVQALHDRGYIHRDIDPSNIMVTASGQVKLIDFGIAKETNSLGTSDRLVTVAGEFVGKPEYAAPELVLGDIKSQSYHTDLYAVGILLFYLLAGHLPFRGSRYEVFQKQLKTPLPVKELSVKSSVKDVIRRSTAKDSSKRYASAAEFRVELDRAVQALDSSSDRKWIMVAGVALGICLAGGFTWKLLYGSNKLDNETDKEVTETVVQEEVISAEVSDLEKYESAVRLYDSEDNSLINEGYNNLKDLAEKGYNPAKKLIAQLMFPRPENLTAVKQEALNRKRQAIQLEEMDEKQACLLIISYLEFSADDVLSNYMLGFCYWRLSHLAEGAAALEKAASMHRDWGSADVHYSEINRRLDLCRNK